MGDAGVEKEKDILNKYNISQVVAKEACSKRNMPLF